MPLIQTTRLGRAMQRYEMGDAGAGLADLGATYTTVTEAHNAVNQTNQYIAALTRDYIAWATLKGSKATAQDVSLYKGYQSFMQAWVAFFNSIDWSDTVFNRAKLALNASEYLDQANNYLAQAQTWRSNLASAGGKPNTPASAEPSGQKPLFNWPEIPWWGYALGGVAVLAATGLLAPITAGIREATSGLGRRR